MPKHCRPSGANKVSKDEKVKQKIRAMIEKSKDEQRRREQEANLLKIQQEKLQALLAESSKVNGKTLKNKIKNINKSYRDSVKEYKMKRKERLKNCRLQRKKEKEEIKRRKQEYFDTINKARINTLPPSKQEINNSDVLNIYIDGWNVISCDKLCRKQMRKQRSNAISRFIGLIKSNFMDKKDGLNVPYDISMNVLFDGNGRNKVNQGINIEFTTKKISVDDKLVNMFKETENKEDNKCNLVITSDRELTFRLYQTGVYMMTSSTFYKTYLKEENNEEHKDNDDNDNKLRPGVLLREKTNDLDLEDKDKEERKDEDGDEDIMDELEKRIRMKMNLHSDDDELQPNDDNHNHNEGHDDTDSMDEDNHNNNEGDEFVFNHEDQNEVDDDMFDDENMNDIDNE